MPGWTIYIAAAAFFAFLGYVLDRHVKREFGHRRLAGGIVLQNAAAAVSLVFLLALFGKPPQAANDLVLWVDLGVVASLASSALYMKALQSKNWVLWMLGALVMVALTAVIWHDSAVHADPVSVFWLAESAFFFASIAMLVVYPRALGKIKLALQSPRGTIIPIELLRGACGHIAWLFFVFACAFSEQPLFLFK